MREVSNGWTWRRVWGRAFVAMAAVVLSLVAAVAPAQANDPGACDNIGGSVASQTQIFVCFKANGHSVDSKTRHFSLYGATRIGAKATSATDCLRIVWATLRAPGTGEWSSAKTARSCKAELDSPGGEIIYDFHTRSDTGATEINMHGCIYLYYNNSSTYGWARCGSYNSWAVID